MFVGKKGNQILAAEPLKLQYTTDSAITSNIKKAYTWLQIGNVLFSSISGGVKKFGQVKEDGTFDWSDVGSVGTAASCHGLNAVVQGLTFGIVEFDADAMTNNLESRVDSFLQSDSALADYIKDEDNFIVWRYGASVGVGAKILGEEVWDTAKYVGGNKIYDYLGVLFPEGYLGEEGNFMFNHEDINDIIFKGYDNPERHEFVHMLEGIYDLKND